MDVMEAVLTRRSIRDFEYGKVTEEDLNKILQGIRHAPSPSNIQPWKCIVLTRESLNRLVELIENRPWGLPEKYKNKAVDAFRKIGYAVVIIQKNASIPCTRSIGAAIQNMLLITHSLGLGSVWLELEPIIGAVRELLAERDIKEDNIIALLPIGRPADIQEEILDRSKKELGEFVAYQ